MSVSYRTFWRELASGRRNDHAGNLVLLFLKPWGWLYATVQGLRATLYRLGIFKTLRLPRPVVSIGNITVGGTGKTPVTAYIARILLLKGYRVAVLSRGYGGALEGQTCVASDGNTIMLSAAECGDEPYLLATTVPGLIVVIGPDRYKAGLMAMQQLNPDIFLLDDGFQHLRLYRDLNILLLDFSRPFGNNQTLPAGILRECSSAINRADLMIFTRAVAGKTISVTPDATPVCVSSHTIIDLLPLTGGAPLLFSHIIGKRILAFAGIADPDSFFAGLRRAGLNLVQTLSFPDHTAYNDYRYREIAEAMQASEAEFIITTEKDGVKLKGLAQEYAACTLLARLELTMDNPALLKNLLDKLLPRHAV